MVHFYYYSRKVGVAPEGCGSVFTFGYSGYWLWSQLQALVVLLAKVASTITMYKCIAAYMGISFIPIFIIKLNGPPFLNQPFI